MRRTFVSLCAAALLTALASAPAAAATLQIEFKDLDVTYNGHYRCLTDAADCDWRATSIRPKRIRWRRCDFFLDNVLVGSLSSKHLGRPGDLGIDPIPASGGAALTPTAARSTC